MLHVAQVFIDRGYHPTVICRGISIPFEDVSHASCFFFFTLVLISFFLSFLAYTKALEDAIAVLDKIAIPVDVNDRKC